MTITNPLALAASLGIKSGPTLKALKDKYNEDGSMRMTSIRALDAIEGVTQSSQDELSAAWQYLVDTGLAWKLQGSIARQADRLINAGFINPPKGVE